MYAKLEEISPGGARVEPTGGTYGFYTSFWLAARATERSPGWIEPIHPEPTMWAVGPRRIRLPPVSRAGPSGDAVPRVKAEPESWGILSRPPREPV